jgi:signal peptidase I
MTTTISKRRKPIDAATLAALLPGLGHLYCGEVRKGILWMGASVGLMIAATVCLMFDPGRTGLTWAMSFVAVDLIVMVVCIVESWRLAKRAGESYQLQDINRWYVYAILFLVSSVGTAVGISFVLRERVVQAFVVPERSMSPTVAPGQRVVARVGVFLDRDPERGEVVIFRSLENRRRFLIKRVVAVAGDTVEWKASGDILINGKFLPHERKDEGDQETNGDRIYQVTLAENLSSGSTTVPPNHCFVLGDNRSKPLDSREFGPVPYASLFAAPIAKGWKMAKID